MGIDAEARRLWEELRPDLEAVRARARTRAERGEETLWDPFTRMVTWESRRGEVIGRWYGEIVATYVLRDRILRWSWAGKSTTSHAEVIARAGADRGAPQLAQSVVGNLDEAEATELVELGLVVARGQGMLVVRGPAELDFIGLFDSARPREDTAPFSVPPPMVAQSIPPGRLSLPPGTIREPARAMFVPVANAVLGRLAKAASGYQQALFVLRPDPLAVSLTVLDAAGLMRSVETSADVIEASARMVEADRAEGNGPWRKLSARIVPKANGGATLTVDML